MHLVRLVLPFWNRRRNRLLLVEVAMVRSCHLSLFRWFGLVFVVVLVFSLVLDLVL